MFNVRPGPVNSNSQTSKVETQKGPTKKQRNKETPKHSRVSPLPLSLLLSGVWTREKPSGE